MKKILVGNVISEKCCKSLGEMGYGVIKLPPFERLQKQVAFHADMLLFYNGTELLTHREYYLKNKELFDGLGVKVLTTDEEMRAEYPYDILFNAVLTSDKKLFSKSAYTSEYIKGCALKIIDVKQGYTACSTCRVSDSGFITTDSGLFECFKSNGIDVCLVQKSGIDLPGYDCGFIGGASVVLDDKVCFFGKIEDHNDYCTIKEFAEKHGKKIKSLSDEKLTDIGGAVVI